MAFHHWKDLGFQWKVFGEDEPAIMCETRMPFGLCTAPGMADRLTSAIVRHMKSKGFTVVGYLDDFLIIANTQDECQKAYDYLLWFLRDLGLPVNEEKCVGPTQSLGKPLCGDSEVFMGNVAQSQYYLACSVFPRFRWGSCRRQRFSRRVGITPKPAQAPASTS
jgi:hypothetical protein